MTSDPRDMDSGLPFPRRFWAIVSVSAGSALYTLDGTIAGVALPTISKALHISDTSSVLLVSVYNLVLAMILLPLAAIGERIGHRRMFTLGLAFYMVAAALCFMADTLPLLLAARALQAVAAGAVLSVSVALVRAIYPATHLGRGLGVNTIAATSGAAIAPAIGGIILAVASWHYVFPAGFPLALLALACGRALPDTDPQPGRFDFVGALLCAVTFGLLIFGFQCMAQGVSLAISVGLLLAGVIVAVLFVRHQRGVPFPVLPVDLLAQPALALSIASAFAAVLASIALLLYVPFQLSIVGFAPAEIGSMLVPYAIATMIFAPLSGMLSDRISPSTLGTVGLVMATISCLLFAYLPADPHYFDIAWRVALSGAGFGMFFSPNGRLLVGSAPRGRAAAASSLLSTTRMFGQALGSTLLGGLLALKLGVAVPALVAAALTALACVLSALRMRLPDPAR